MSIWYKKMITVCIGMSMWTSWPQVGLPDRVAWQRPRLPPSSPPYRPGLLDQASYLFLLCMNLYNMAWLLTILTRFEAIIWKLWSRDLFIFIYISQGGPLKLCRAQRVPHRTAKEAFSMIFLGNDQIQTNLICWTLVCPTWPYLVFSNTRPNTAKYAQIRQFGNWASKI